MNNSRCKALFSRPGLLKGLSGVLFSLSFLLNPSISRSEDLIFAVKSGNMEPYNIALKGIQETLRKKPGGDVKIFDISGGEGQWKDVVKEIIANKPHLIITVGTTASRLAKRDVSNIPIVFSMVLNPVESGIVKSIASPGGNITGASLDIPLETQFQYILQMAPSAKNVGVLFNPGESAGIIERAKVAAGLAGLTLIAEPVRAETELPAAIDRVLRKIDVLWSVADPTVFSPPAVRQIIMEAIKYRVPFMGLSPLFVKGGALFSIKWNDFDIGAQAGEIAAKILSGTKPGDIPVTTPRELSISVNIRTSEAIGMRFPKELLNNAEVFK